MKCIACGYERQDDDTVPEWQCPNCKVAYNKVSPEYIESNSTRKKKQQQSSKPHLLKRLCNDANSYLNEIFKDKRTDEQKHLDKIKVQEQVKARAEIYNKKNHKITCKQCSNEMFKTTYTTGNYIGILKALIVFILGVTIIFMFFFTGIGIVIGLLMILLSLGMGGKKHKIWKCKKCGYYYKVI